MKLISVQENFKKGLLIVSHGTGKNINLPILNNILIKAYQNSIELISTNLEIGIIHKLRGKVEEEGEFTVDAKIITEYVNLLPSENVEIEEIEGELKIECDNYKTKIKGESAKDFPLIPSVSSENYYACSVGDLKKALNGVAFAVSNSENRIELSGVLFNFENNKLILVATDSYRLAEKIIEINSNNEFNNQKLIVPARTVQELLRILSNYNSEDLSFEQKGEVRISVSDNQILFTIESVELVSRLINGQYPDYKQIIPDKSKTDIVTSKQNLSRAVKAVAIFSKTGVNDVNLEFKNNKIIISASSGQSGESRVDVDAEISGIDNEVAINYRYLVDGLNNISSDRVKLKVVSNNTPCVLTAEAEDDYLYVVMPIRQ
ncbi:MAG: DNA polymerase III subunit beta [Candidatus Falkowbacteria bacterium]